MTKQQAWNYAIGLIKVDGLEPSEDFKRLIELESDNKITTKEMKEYLDAKYGVATV